MSVFMGNPRKGRQPFAHLFHAKEQCCINNSRNDFCIISKEKDRYLVKLKVSNFINHFKPSLNLKEGNAQLVLFTQ